MSVWARKLEDFLCREAVSALPMRRRARPDAAAAPDHARGADRDCRVRLERNIDLVAVNCEIPEK
jgi:hypothetical protein